MIMKYFFIGLIGILLYGCSGTDDTKKLLNEIRGSKPNIILCMADDLGWGDPGYNGNPVVVTPQLDDMAAQGFVFNRFYASSPVCSPTRASCMTGRHPYRYGIFSANVGHLPEEEITMAEILREQGYRTGHFGKWHLGTMTTDVHDSNRGGRDDGEHYAPPWKHGFDVCFSTEAKVPTYDPMQTPLGWMGNTDPSKPFGTYYWNEKGKIVTENLQGDDSRVIMDRVVPFIEDAVNRGQPFFAVVWFHTPHLPVLADSLKRMMYYEFTDEERNYFGCITAMDEQVGRLRKALRDQGVAENTMLWFASDNGPEGPEQTANRPGSAGPFKGRKRSLYEGGVRVPGILEWPAFIRVPGSSDVPASTLDYVPTVLDVLGLEMGHDRPQDGISLLPLIFGEHATRDQPIFFESGQQLAAIYDRYKLYSKDAGQSYALYDLVEDRGEENNLADTHPDMVDRMSVAIENWRMSCQASLTGKDY
jgi:arylsulfatase A-like enzyme